MEGSSSAGRCCVAYTVREEDTNPRGALHGGASATLVDLVTTIAMVDDHEDSVKRLGVSVDMNLSYLGAAKLNDDLLIDGWVVKKGRKLAFTECTIKNKQSQKILVAARHTKYIQQLEPTN